MHHGGLDYMCTVIMMNDEGIHCHLAVLPAMKNENASCEAQRCVHSMSHSGAQEERGGKWTREGARRGRGRRERRKRGCGLKDQVERSRGTETLITEALAKIKPTDPLRSAKLQRVGIETDHFSEISSAQGTILSMTL